MQKLLKYSSISQGKLINFDRKYTFCLKQQKKNRYTPSKMTADYKFKPFIPEFLPAVGDIDAFLKIIPPETTLSGDIFDENVLQLGLLVLDEPAANQSDPALLHLQLRASNDDLITGQAQGNIVSCGFATKCIIKQTF